MSPLLKGSTVRITVPMEGAANVNFDAVATHLQVHAEGKKPLLCVTGTYKVASGDLAARRDREAGEIAWHWTMGKASLHSRSQQHYPPRTSERIAVSTDAETDDSREHLFDDDRQPP